MRVIVQYLCFLSQNRTTQKWANRNRFTIITIILITIKNDLYRIKYVIYYYSEPTTRYTPWMTDFANTPPTTPELCTSCPPMVAAKEAPPELTGAGAGAARRDADDTAKRNLNAAFERIPILRVCVIPRCPCAEKRKKPRKHTCDKCESIYYCCHKTLHSCYHYCPAEATDCRNPIVDCTGGGIFSKLERI